MIVYEGTKVSFQRDVMNGTIAGNIDKLFKKLYIPKEQYAEFRSWENSLPRMGLILSDERIPKESQVAIEYQIPLTSKRVDFMIGGRDGENENVVVVELKQWDTCTATSRENVVKAYTGGALREVVHPSQQAYSYAKLIENFNESVRENNISLIPCAYLHNYKNINKGQICHSAYSEAIKDAPVFLQENSEELQNFIAKFIKKPSNKKLFDIIENGKLKPSKSLQDSVGSVLNGKQEFIMIDEQQVAYATILKLVQNTIANDEKHTIIVQGGPGTGKSVIAINLLAKILNNGFSCFYVTKTSAPRATFAKSLIRGEHTLSYLRGLFKSSGTFYDVPLNTFDCLLVDEAHRLNAKSGLYSNQGENQIKEIINASKISVFFIDEDQIISTKDIGSVDEIKKWSKQLGSKVHYGDNLKLLSQFRCNGSDGYLAFLDDVLQIRNTANYNWFDLDYDIQFFDNPSNMREALRKTNVNNKSRMIAGYCYPWNSRNDKSEYDIELESSFKAKWNFTTDQWATDPESFEQVGCIHSSQGLEFDYVGIIIGTDMRYENGNVITDYKKRDKGDATIKGLRMGKNDELADRIVRNTYKTLLSRGQKGCYVYCEDKALGKYLAARCENTQEAIAEQRIYPIVEAKPELQIIRYVKVKFYEAAPAAGPSEDLGDTNFEEIQMPETDVLPGTDFVLQIRGRSMEPEIMDGDFVCVNWKARKSIRNGEIGIFNVDGAPYCKHFYQDRYGNVWLISANEELKDTNVFIPCESDIRFHCRGKVLGHNCTLPDYFIAEIEKTIITSESSQ